MTTTTTPTRSEAVYHLPPAAELQVSMVTVPALSVVSVLVGAMGRADLGVPAPLRARLRAQLDPAARCGLRPLLVSGLARQPDCVAAQPTVGRDVPLHRSLELLRDLPADALRDDLLSTFPEAVPPSWRAVLDRPAAWQHGYAAAMHAGWQVLAPVWRAHERAIREETDRVGRALLRGGPALALGALHPRLRSEGTTLRLPTIEPRYRRLPSTRRIVLAPLVGAGAAFVTRSDGPELLVGYPVPLRPVGHPPSSSSLDVVLGPVRAALLRAASPEASVTEVADRAVCGSLAVTYHLDRLVAAQLVRRRKAGRRQLLVRTERGDALLELLG